MKRLGLNAIVLNSESGGLGVYLRNLIHFLLKKNDVFESSVFLSRDTFDLYSDLNQNGILKRVDTLSYKPVNRIIREPFLWQKLLSENQIVLFHSPISYIPWGVKIPAVITIHDLGFFHFPGNYTTLRRIFLQYMIRRSVDMALKIITISEFTKQDIVKTFNVDPAKIRVIYEGIDKEKYQQKIYPLEYAFIKKKYNLPDKYILSVGHLEPRKNYSRLIRAFELIKRKHKIPHQLVIVGRENWKFQDVYHTVHQLGLNDEVIFTKFAEEDELIAMYQNADVFVTTSIFEGFGFTPLESMAAGTPVAVANATSLPEVVGDAALLFDPLNVDDMAEKLYRLIADRNLQQTLIQKGYENIKRFDWDRCCVQTIEEYQNLLTVL